MSKWDLGLIERAFVEAAFDPQRWNAAMDTAAKVAGARGAALFSLQGKIPLMPSSDSLSEGNELYIRDGWIQRDERYRAVPAMMRKGVGTEFDFISPDELNRHPYYQEFLAPLGLQWFAGTLIAAEDDQWSLSLQRSPSQGPFQQAELDQLASLSARLSTVAVLARAIGLSAVSAALEAFEFSGTAIAQLDSAGDIIKLNKLAERLVDNGIRVVKKRLVADERDATNSLDRSLHALLWNSSEAVLMPPVPLPRVGRRPLLAYPLSLSSIVQNPFAHCRALVILVDLERSDRPPVSLLCSTFKLTPAEAKLASQTCNWRHHRTSVRRDRHCQRNRAQSTEGNFSQDRCSSAIGTRGAAGSSCMHFSR